MQHLTDGPAGGDPATVDHWLASYHPVRIDDEIIGIGIVAVDTTERRQAEALRASLYTSPGALVGAY
jgi:hypothetical protein